MKPKLFLLAVCLIISAQVFAQQNIKILLVEDPYSDSRTGPEKLKGPEMLNNSGLNKTMKDLNCDLVMSVTIEMPEELNYQYGEWNRASLTNNVIMHAISDFDQGEVFVLGLLSGNKSLIGMLAGLQHMGPDRKPLKDSRNRDIIGLPRLGASKPLKVGMILIHSEAAFNTPDITLEGDMGGMNAAVAAGQSNSALRLQAGLDPPIATKNIVMLGAWDVNSYEEHALDNSFVKVIPIDDVNQNKDVVIEEVKRLSEQVDVIYVHLDLSILSRISSEVLGEMLTQVFTYRKVNALGIASCPDDPDKQILDQANHLIDSSLRGVKLREF